MLKHKADFFGICADVITVANQMKKSMTVDQFVRGFSGGRAHEEELLLLMHTLNLVMDDDIRRLSTIKWVGVYR